MKQVAGTLRLDLAQYRELAAFASFGSDLDKGTQAKLNRGARMVELLKQPQYKPLTVQEQVAVLFAGTRGFLDDIAVESVIKFEAEFLEFMNNAKSAVLDSIAEKEKIDDAVEADLKAAIEEFKKGFSA